MSDRAFLERFPMMEQGWVANRFHEVIETSGPTATPKAICRITYERLRQEMRLRGPSPTGNRERLFALMREHAGEAVRYVAAVLESREKDPRQKRKQAAAAKKAASTAERTARSRR